MEKDNTNLAGVGLAYYKKKDWNRFIETIDDRESMHDSWKEWHKSYIKTKKTLISQGFIVNDVVVDIDELQAYCKMRGIKNDGEARSQFASMKQSQIQG